MNEVMVEGVVELAQRADMHRGRQTAAGSLAIQNGNDNDFHGRCGNHRKVPLRPPAFACHDDDFRRRRRFD
jgi:hypothetical protein